MTQLASGLKNRVKRFLVGSRILRTAAACLAKRVVVTRFHSVPRDTSTFVTSIGHGIMHPEPKFEAQMRLIAARFTPITLDDVAAYLRGETDIPRRAVAVTFDDGFRDNYEYAVPILDRYGIKATFYVTVRSIEGPPPWFCRLSRAMQETGKPDWVAPTGGRTFPLGSAEQRLEAFFAAVRPGGVLSDAEQEEYVRAVERQLEVEPLGPEDGLMMDWPQVAALKDGGHIVGSHTMTHPNLAHVGAEQARWEITESKRALEERLAAPVVHFSYPSPTLQPHYNEQTVSMTEQAGYRTAVTSDAGPMRRGQNPLSIRRIVVPQDPEALRWALEVSFAGHRV